MSVTQTKTIYINPIFRVPGAQVFNPSILGRYHSSNSITGDGTGGVYIFGHVFQAVMGMFGPHALFDVRMVDIWVSTGLAAGAYYVASVDSRERTNSPGAFGYTWNGSIANASGLVFSEHYIPDFKFKFSDDPTIPTQFNIAVSPNTNAVVCSTQLAGYIYDERYI